jgi:hypothetical protein
MTPYFTPLALLLGLHLPWLYLAGFFDWFAAAVCSVLPF